MKWMFWVTIALVACGPRQVTDRQAGERQPLSARCEVLDGTRCLLPWPSSTYTVLDPSSPTRVRIALTNVALPVLDDAVLLNRADGFSVVTPLAVGFDRALAMPDASAVRLIDAAAGVTRGQTIPVRLAIVPDSGGSKDTLLVAYPLRPLAYDHDYVAVVLDDVKAADASPLPVPRAVGVALGLVSAQNDDDAALRAYHAPTRELLAGASIDPHHVLRVWDFSTRSAADVVAPLRAMRDRTIAAVNAGAATVSIDTATLLDGARGIELVGSLGGLPNFLGDGGNGVLSFDAAGLPIEAGTRVARFRALVPAGASGTTYRVVIYGHGTGGTVEDDTFDDEIVMADAVKINIEWLGWTQTDALNTFIAFDTPFTGADRSTSKLLQALAHAAALEAALDGGPLATTLGAATITPAMGAPVANPAAGRSPDMATLVYAGGSLGGTLGYVHALVDERVHAAVLNVPGAGWTHFVPPSLFWSQIRPLLSTSSDLDLALGLAMTQNGWDPVDGGAWSAVGDATPRPFLLQESIGDPVLPNIGTDLVATSSGAVQVGAVLQPIAGVSAVSDSNRTAITQYRVPPSTGAFDTHGFAANDTPAGNAARAQIAAFLGSVWAGAPKITVPDACAAQGGSCDFSAE